MDGWADGSTAVALAGAVVWEAGLGLADTSVSLATGEAATADTTAAAVRGVAVLVVLVIWEAGAESALDTGAAAGAEAATATGVAATALGGAGVALTFSSKRVWGRAVPFTTSDSLLPSGASLEEELFWNTFKNSLYRKT